MSQSDRHVIVGVTGASGAQYARRLVECLVKQEIHVHLVASPYGQRLFADELNIAPLNAATILGSPCDLIEMHNYNDVGAVLASGSFRNRGMVICPCSASTMGALAAGLGENLLHRAAQVAMKEGRRLIVVYREMPMSQIDLKNALALSQAGAVICPSNPGYYLLPKTIDELIDFVVGKLLDLLDIDHDLNTRWTGDVPAE